MKKIFILIFTLIISGCSSNYETVNQVSDISYIQLEGNFLGKEMVLDKYKISLKKVKTFTENNSEVARFPIDNGKHQIIIKSGDKILVNEKFLTSTGEVYKVYVR